jgi:energy-coupling factor transporter transmembrane protein EcfT
MISTASEKHTYMVLAILTTIILLFAFNINTYESCSNGTCKAIFQDANRIRCVESNFKNSQIYNFYVAINIIFTILAIIILVYIYYATKYKYDSRRFL